MKATGEILKIDSVGRVVIPKALRNKLDLSLDDRIEVFIDDNEAIILKKYMPSCIFCGEYENTVSYNGKLICKSCLEKLSKIS